MKKIAITGNIASGKSIAENYFKSLGFKTLCLDFVTSSLYEDNDCRKELFNSFKTSNKKEISKIVFTNKDKLKELEQILLPKIKKIMFDFFDNNKNEKMVFVAAPTLFESGFDKFFDIIILISSKKEIRLQRIIERDKVDAQFAKHKINAQLDEKIKIPKCTYVIENNGKKDEFLFELEKTRAKLDIL